VNESLSLGCNYYSIRIGDGMKKEKENSGNDVILAALSFVIAITALGIDIFSIELLSNLEIGASMQAEKIANGLYVFAILLMIFVAGENRK
jgi:hypothetical protein